MYSDSMVYFDAHCHLMDDSVFLDAQGKGIKAFIVNSTKPSDWQKVADLNKRLTGIYFCAGIHPWYIDDAYPGWDKDLCTFLKEYPMAMVGEVGLDKNKPFFNQQLKIFERCVDIATTYNRKIHIHCVGGWQELLEIITQYPDIQPLFHRFSGDEFIISQLKRFNPYFSILNGRYADLIPDNRLLVESDSPDGLKTPTAIPTLVKNLHLDLNYLNQTFLEFIGEL